MIDLSAARYGRRRGSAPGRLRRRRFRVLPSGRTARHATIWAAIWLFLLSPTIIDFLNGYLTDSSGCRVIGVVDGDTVGMHCPGTIGISKARMVGYDTPEIFSPKCFTEAVKGTLAKWTLRLALWRADRIHVLRNGTDRYGRALVRLKIDGVDVSTTMTATGMARAYAGGRRQGWCL